MSKTTIKAGSFIFQIITVVEFKMHDFSKLGLLRHPFLPLFNVIKNRKR